MGKTNSKRQSSQNTQAAVAADAAKGQLVPQPGVKGRGRLLIAPVTPKHSADKSLSAAASLNAEDGSLCAHLGTFCLRLLGG